MSVFLIVFGAVFLFWFTAPFFRWRVCNPGNLLGGAVSLAVLLCGVFYTPLAAWIAHVRQTAAGRVLLCAVAAIFCACILFAVVIGLLTVRLAHQKIPVNAVLLVLGCRVYGARPSRLLRWRADRAAKYLKAHPQSVAVLSGGQGRDEAISEAEAMRRLLTQAGIAPSRLLLEDKSTSTQENIAFSGEILAKHGLSDRPVAVVTNSFHLLRACFMAKRWGMRAYGLAARSSVLSYPTFFVRELLGLCKFFLFHK